MGTFEKEALVIWACSMTAIAAALLGMGIIQEARHWKTLDIFMFLAIIAVGSAKFSVVIAIYRDRRRMA